jgi:hypothetical protein
VIVKIKPIRLRNIKLTKPPQKGYTFYVFLYLSNTP